MIPLKSSSIVHVMISSMSMPICNYFHTKRANTGKKPPFRGYPSLTPACTGLLESRWSALKLLQSAFNAENFMCRLSWSRAYLQPFCRNSLLNNHFNSTISQYKLSLNCALQPKMRKIHYLNFEVQGRSKLSMLINLKSSSLVLVMI